MNKFEQTQNHLKIGGGYATRQCWAGNRKIYYFLPVAHGVEKVSPDGQSMPMVPFYAERVGDGPLTPYIPSDEDFNATDWQIFRKTYVQHL
jgi:hypothetical protein